MEELQEILEKTKLVSEEQFIKQNKNKEEEKEIDLKEELKVEESEEEENKEEEKGEKKETPKDVFMINLEEEKGQSKKIGGLFYQLTVRSELDLQVLRTGKSVVDACNDHRHRRVDVHLRVPVHVPQCPGRPSTRPVQQVAFCPVLRGHSNIGNLHHFPKRNHHIQLRIGSVRSTDLFE